MMNTVFKKMLLSMRQVFLLALSRSHFDKTTKASTNIKKYFYTKFIKNQTSASYSRAYTFSKE